MTNAHSQLIGEPCSPVSTHPTALATETAIATQIAVPTETADQDVAGDDSGKTHFKRVTRETIAEVCKLFHKSVDEWDGTDLMASPTYRTWARDELSGARAGRVCRMKTPFLLEGSQFSDEVSRVFEVADGKDYGCEYLHDSLKRIITQLGFQPERDYDGLKFDVTDPKTNMRFRFESKHPQKDRHLRITHPKGFYVYQWEIKSDSRSLRIEGGPSEDEITYRLEAGPGPDIVYSLLE